MSPCGHVFSPLDSGRAVQPVSHIPYLPPTVSIVYPLLSEPFSCRGPSKPRRLHGLRLARCCFMRIGLETYMGSGPRPGHKKHGWTLDTAAVISSLAQSRQLLPVSETRTYTLSYSIRICPVNSTSTCTQQVNKKKNEKKTNGGSDSPGRGD